METTSQHPIAATMARVTSLDAYFSGETGGLDAGWFRASDLLHEASAPLAEGLARIQSAFPTMDARTIGATFIGQYSWYVSAAAIAAVMADRRAPDFSPENVGVHYSSTRWEYNGESGESLRYDVRFLGGRFAALPDDPEATHPDAVIVPDMAALREWLRARLEEHFKPLIEQLYGRTRLGRGAQWSLVADSCASLFLSAGEKIGSAESGQAHGLAFIKIPGSPLNNPKTGYVKLEHEGHCATFSVRGGCCRWYTLPNESKCTTCVLRPPAERDALLLKYMAEQHASEKAEV